MKSVAKKKFRAQSMNNQGLTKSRKFLNRKYEYFQSSQRDIPSLVVLNIEGVYRQIGKAVQKEQIVSSKFQKLLKKLTSSSD